MEPKEPEVIKLQPKAKIPKPPVDSITVVEMVYHRRARNNPSQYAYRFKRDLKTQEQPWQRDSLEIGKDSQYLIPDKCWVEKPGMVIVENTSGTAPFLKPTEEQILEASKHVLEVTLGNSDRQMVLLIPPGENLRITIDNPKDLVIRCQSGICKFTLTVLPE